VAQPGRDGLAAWFSQVLAAGASVAAGQDRPAPTITSSRWCTRTTLRLVPHPSRCESTAGTTRPGSGSATTAARRRAAPGACPAARTWTRAAITSTVRQLEQRESRSRTVIGAGLHRARKCPRRVVAGERPVRRVPTAR
jgi:hypothetical protein